MDPSSQNPQIYKIYRPDIDGLRCFAALPLLIFHIFPNLIPGGFVGVDIFFIISGYLITLIIYVDLEKGSFRFSEFYIQRIKRIFPALIVVLMACLLAGWFFLLANEYESLGKHIAGGAGFVSNIVLWKEAGYFDSASKTKPLLNLWSLGIEEQFYILWPLIIFFSWRLRLNLLVVTIFFLLISFSTNIYLINQDQVTTFYLPHTRFWELLCGSLLAVFSVDKIKYKSIIQAVLINSRWFLNFISILGFSTLLCGFFIINKEFLYPGLWALIPVIGTSLLIVAGPNALINRTILSNRYVVWLGLISYPLYLWQWPLISFVRVIEGKEPSWQIGALVFFLSMLLAWLTYSLIEKPFRQKVKKSKIVVLILSMIAILLIGLDIYRGSGYKFRGATEQFSFAVEQLGGLKVEYSQNEICYSRYPLGFQKPKNSHFFCVTNRDQAPTVMLLGNSFANHHYPGFTSNIDTKHQTYLSIGICDFGFVERQSLTAEPKHDVLCRSGYRGKEQDWIKRVISSSPSIKYAIVDGLLASYTPDYVNTLKSEIKFLEEHGIKVVIFTPHIVPAINAESCIGRPLIGVIGKCNFHKDEVQNLNSKFKPLMDSIKISNPNVLFFDQNKLFCKKNNLCSYQMNGVPLSRDIHSGGSGGHLSVYGSEELAKIFVEWAVINLPEFIRQ